jgi:hypothetical protein
MRQGADRHARVYEDVDYNAPHPAGRSGDEHRRQCHEDLDVVCSRRTG